MGATPHPHRGLRPAGLRIVSALKGRPRTVLLSAATICVLCAGCTGDPEVGAPTSQRSETLSDGATTPGSGPSQGDVPSTDPSQDDGPSDGAGRDNPGGGADRTEAGGGTGDGGGTGNGGLDSGGGDGDGDGSGPEAGNGGSESGSGDGRGGGTNGSDSGDGDDEGSSIEVAGPTLENDYPEYWGNIYRDDRSKCANFVNYFDHDITIESISVSSPLLLVTGCSPHSGEPAGSGCEPGAVLAAARTGVCTLGVVFADGTDFSQNYTPQNSWRLSAECTDTATEPCSAPEVVAAAPSPSNPVTVAWTMTEPMRFCGATDYADDQGNPGGAGYPPESGCSAETTAPSSDVPGDDG